MSNNGETLQAQMQALREEMNGIKKRMREQAKDVFRQGAKRLFDENPELESFGWEQYTPYFCDGEPCYFGVYIDEPDINGVTGYEISEEDEHADLAPLQEKVVEFLRFFEEDDFEGLFGDHAKVTVSKDGVEVSDYSDHD